MEPKHSRLKVAHVPPPHQGDADCAAKDRCTHAAERTNPRRCIVEWGEVLVGLELATTSAGSCDGRPCLLQILPGSLGQDEHDVDEKGQEEPAAKHSSGW